MLEGLDRAHGKASGRVRHFVLIDTVSTFGRSFRAKRNAAVPPNTFTEDHCHDRGSSAVALDAHSRG